MKRMLAIVLSLSMVLALTACGGKEEAPAAPAAPAAPSAPAAPAAPADTDPLADLDPIVITLAHCNADGSAPANGVEYFVEAIEERTGGKITFEVYGGSQLGGYVELTESMAMGGLQMGELDPTLMTEYAPELPMLIQPFLIEDYDHFGRVLALDEVKTAEAKLEENNIKTLGYMYCGFRSMCMSREVSNVDECKGLVIRSPEADIYMNTLKRLGMAPTPMAMSEMYTAMKSGVIEGAEPAVSAIWDNSLYEVCPYILKSNHMFSFNNIVVAADWWETLPEAYQTIIAEEVVAACEKEQVEMEEREGEYYTMLTDAGCTVSEWDNYQELVDLFAPTWEETANSIGGDAPALLEAMMAA